MSDVPEQLRYSKTHEWASLQEDNIVTIGITDHAQQQLGDLVYVDLPSLDSDYQMGDEIAVVESVKTAADIYAPFTGKVIAVNEDLINSPEQVNQDPYGKGWLFRLQLEDSQVLQTLMDASSYRQSIQA